ncbi:MAG: YdeI/OmpD-associated family protein [Opitutaceae bacterium]
MKTNPQVDAYIVKSAEFARPILKHLRTLVHRGCPEAVETIKWGVPHFEHGGVLCSMAAFKAHCAFGFWHRGMEKVLGADGAKAKTAMGSFGRIASLADLPDDKTMIRYVQAAVKLNESGASGRQRRANKAKPEAKVLDDLASELKKNAAAAVAFEKFSPSHRREYIEWIVEAKREETRAKRLATTVEWLRQGKSRNWKHENR